MKLISHGPTATRSITVFVVCPGSVSLAPPPPYSALPPLSPRDASPKAVSGRTSYLQVRLAFHPYTQILPDFCNSRGFGPPARVTALSACPCVAHLVSCPIPATQRPLQTRFRSASGCHSLRLATEIDSLAHSPKGTPSQCGQRHTALTVCRHPVSDSLSLPSPGFFSPFPHGTVRYRSSSVFSLGAWSPPLHAGFLVSRTTQDPDQTARLPPTGLSPPPAGLPRPFGFSLQPSRRSSNPIVRKPWFGLLRFRSPLLAESFPLLGLLRCFTSPGSPPAVSRRVPPRYGWRVSPFGYPRLLRLHTPHQGFSQCTASFLGT